MWADVDAHTSRWDRHIRIHRGTHRKVGCNTDAVADRQMGLRDPHKADGAGSQAGADAPTAG